MRLKLYSLIIISILLFISCNNNGDIKNDIEKLNLNGKVKSITENSFDAVEKFGEIVKGEKLVDKILNKENRLTTFNKNGFLTESLVGFWPAKYKYDEENKLVEENWYESDTKILYKYNAKGNMTESNNYYKNDLVQKQKMIYDEEGNEIETNSYDADGKLEFKQKKTYKNRKLIDIKEYDSDGILSLNHKYDSNGNQIEITIYDSLGEITSKSNFKFNENNEIIETIDNTPNKSQTKSKYTYRKLDSNKNWTEKIEYENNMPKLIIDRKIEYYK